MPSGPIAFEAFDFLMAACVCSGENTRGEAWESFFAVLVVVLAVLEVLCRTIEVYCLLKQSASCWAEVMYLPLNFMAEFSLAGGWPLRFLIILNNLPESVLWPRLDIVSLHFVRLCDLIAVSMALLSSARRGESEVSTLVASLCFIRSMASAGSSGRTCFVLP